MKGVKDNGINRNVLGGLIIVNMVNLKQPSLQPVITIPNKKHVPRKRLEGRIGKQKKLKSLILIRLMSILIRHVLFLESLLLFPIERGNIKNFVPLLITSLKCLLHLKDVDFESRTNN
jgi:hypothetical protein